MIKFTIQAKEIQQSLSVVSMGIGKNTTMPILDSLLFSVSDDKVEVISTDLEVSMSSALSDIQTEGDGSFCVPVKPILRLVKNISGYKTITFEHEDSQLTLLTDKGKYQIGCYNADDFPNRPVSEGEAMSLKPMYLFEDLRSVSFAAGSDELRPVLSGVLFENYGGGDYRYVATDAHRLAIRGDMSREEDVNSYIVPMKCIKIVQKIIANTAEDTIFISQSEQNINFSIGNISVTANLIDGKYPNWKAVIPKDNHIKANVNVGLLKDAVDRVSVFSNEITHQVRLSFKDSLLSVSAEDVDFSNSAIETIKLNEPVAEDIEIGFNGMFLKDVLSAIKKEDITIDLKHPDKAVLISSDSNSTYLLMPIMLGE